MDAVAKIASKHGLAIVEDAAHAPGASYRGRACGTLGDVGCFSFFSNKNLPIGEGGMVVTADDELVERIRLLRSHGMTTLTWDRHQGHASSYDVLAKGFNYRLDEFRAALGLVQLRRLPAGNAARARIAGRYREALAGLDGIELPFGDPEAQASSSHHLEVVLLPAGANRAEVRERLEGDRIQTSVHYPPIHRFSTYAELSGRALPQTDAVADRILTLPLYPSMSDAQVDLVAGSLREAL
jgi:dTDP-4-amino-4,6-dideoxygalactose transaminase